MKKILLGFVLMAGLLLTGCNTNLDVSFDDDEKPASVTVIDTEGDDKESIDVVAEDSKEILLESEDTVKDENVNVSVTGGDAVTVKLVDVSVEPEPVTKVAKGPVVPKIVYYHGAECPHCHAFKKFLPEVEKMYPGFVAEEYEVWHNEANAAKARKHLASLGQEFRAVPSIVIGEDVLTGFNEAEFLSLMEKHFGEGKQ